MPEDPALAAADLTIRNACVLSLNAARTVYWPGAVAIAGRRIAAVGPEDEVLQSFRAARTIDAGGGIVHPGFIDAHNHIVHTSCRGVFNGIHDSAGKGVSFATWKAEVSEADEAAATAMAALEMLRGGFTMFVEPGSLFSTAAAAEAVERVGLRALFAPAYLWDRPEPFAAIPALASAALMARVPVDTDRCLAQLDAELARNRDADAPVRGYVFIYGEGTASPELLRAAHAVARERGVPFHLHAGYTPGGAEISRRMDGKRPLLHLADLGVLDVATTVVHANALDEAEEAELRQSGAGVIWCPTAYFSLGLAGQVPFRMAARARAGVCLALGADGTLDCPPGASMLAARFAAQHHGETLTPEALLEMQTLNGAAVAGMTAEVGSLEPGKRADIVVRSPRAAEGHPDNNPAHLLALTLGPGSVETVLVDGRIVFDGGRSTLVDEAEAMARADASVRARAARLGIDPGPRWPRVPSAFA